MMFVRLFNELCKALLSLSLAVFHREKMSSMNHLQTSSFKAL